MKSKINFLRLVFTTAVVLFLSANFASAQDPVPDQVITIDVAPNVLNIASEGTVVTVHTNIAYSLVSGASVTLNDIEIAWWKSDSRGQFVAKFNMIEVETLVTAGVLEEGNITLTLSGETKLGAKFSGSQEIAVIDLESKGK